MNYVVQSKEARCEMPTVHQHPEILRTVAGMAHKVRVMKFLFNKTTLVISTASHQNLLLASLALRSAAWQYVVPFALLHV